VRPLGSRRVPAWAAIETLGDGKTRLVVVERITRGEGIDDQEIAECVREARALLPLEHPNLGRVRDVIIRGNEVLVVSDFVDGAQWSELGAREPRPGLEITLRVLVDVLSGLSAIHNLRDARREPLHLVHGQLTPDCVIVGVEGTARVVRPIHLRSDGGQSGKSGSAYLAPELLLGDESADVRADVYGVGVMLWEALTGKRLFENLPASAIITNLLSGRVPKPEVPEAAPWAAPLVEVVTRALSADPAKRYPTATALAAEIRRIAGARLAPAVRVAGLVRGAYGDRIRARRGEIERGEARPEQPERETRPVIDPSDMDVEEDVDIRVSAVPEPVPESTVTTRPPPPALEATGLAPPAVPPPPRLPAKAPPPRVPSRVAPPTPAIPIVVPPDAVASVRAQPVAPPVSDLPPPDLLPPPPAPVAVAPAAPVAVMAPPVPPPARVPPDVAEQAVAQARAEQANPVFAAAFEAPSPMPAVPPIVVTPEPIPAVEPPRRRRKALVIIAPVALAIIVLVWWLGSSGGGTQAGLPLPAVPSGSAVAATRPPPTPSAPAATPPAETSTAATTSTSAPSVASEAPAAPPPTTSPVAAAPEETATGTPTSATSVVPATPPGLVVPAVPAPAPPPRTQSKRRYDPEGI
jgi:serine/threonine-protein kinase